MYDRLGSASTGTKVQGQSSTPTLSSTSCMRSRYMLSTSVSAVSLHPMWLANFSKRSRMALFVKVGGPTGNRTPDQPVMSGWLYQLSYRTTVKLVGRGGFEPPCSAQRHRHRIYNRNLLNLDDIRKFVTALNSVVGIDQQLPFSASTKSVS